MALRVRSSPLGYPAPSESHRTCGVEPHRTAPIRDLCPTMMTRHVVMTVQLVSVTDTLTPTQPKKQPLKRTQSPIPMPKQLGASQQPDGVTPSRFESGLDRLCHRVQRVLSTLTVKGRLPRCPPRRARALMKPYLKLKLFHVPSIGRTTSCRPNRIGSLTSHSTSIVRGQFISLCLKSQ